MAAMMPCHMCKVNVGNEIGGPCPSCEVLERARLDALAKAGWGGTGDEVTDLKIREFGFGPVEWPNATAETIAAPDAQAAKAAFDDVCAAHLATFREATEPEKAFDVARKAKDDPTKGADIVVDVMLAAALERADGK